MTKLSDSCRKAAYENFARANEHNNTAHLLAMAALELEEMEAQLAKHRPKAKKQGPDPRQRVFLFDLDKALSWADLDREIEELEMKEKGAATCPMQSPKE